MRKVVLTYGLIAGAILSGLMAATIPFQDMKDFDTGKVVGYATMVLAFLLVFFGVRSYRDNVAGGTVSFGRAFSVGLLITMVASVCYVITWEIIFFTGNQNFTAAYTEYVLEQERDAGATEAAIAARRVEMERFMELYRNPVFNSAVTFLEPLPVGLLFTLISAAALRTRRRVAATT